MPDAIPSFVVAGDMPDYGYSGSVSGKFDISELTGDVVVEVCFVHDEEVDTNNSRCPVDLDSLTSGEARPCGVDDGVAV